MSGASNGSGGDTASKHRGLPRRFIQRVLGPLARRWRAFMIAPVQAEYSAGIEALHARIDEVTALNARLDEVNATVAILPDIIHTRTSEATVMLHGIVDAGVHALAARATVHDIALDGIRAHLASFASHPARLDALSAEVAAIANRQRAAYDRLERQQRLIFDGLLDELMQLRQDSEARALACVPNTVNLHNQIDRVEQYGHASARRIALPLGSDVLVRSEAGYILCAGTDLSVLITLIETGELERGTRILIESLLQPGDCFVDVGANIGMHTLAAGRALQRQGVIHAFEPFQATCKLLTKSVRMNGLADMTTIHAKAASNREATQSFYLGAGSGHHSLLPLQPGDSASDDMGFIAVSTVRLDDVIDAPVSLLKIDAKGAELDVLAGASRLVSANQDIALIVEFGPSHLLRSGHTPDAWLAQFAAYGFVWRAIDPITGALSDITAGMLAAIESTNLFFARPNARCWTLLPEQA